MATVGVSTTNVIELDESTDEEVVRRQAGEATVTTTTSNRTTPPPATKKQRVDAAPSSAESIAAAGTTSTGAAPSSAESIAAAGTTSTGGAPESVWGTERRSHRSLADSLSFSELQAQQRALEQIHRRTHKKLSKASSHKASAKPSLVATAAPAAKPVAPFVRVAPRTAAPPATATTPNGLSHLPAAKPTVSAAAAAIANVASKPLATQLPKPAAPAPKASSHDWSTPSLMWRIPPPKPAPAVAAAAAALQAALQSTTATAAATAAATPHRVPAPTAVATYNLGSGFEPSQPLLPFARVSDAIAATSAREQRAHKKQSGRTRSDQRNKSHRDPSLVRAAATVRETITIDSDSDDNYDLLSDATIDYSDDSDARKQTKRKPLKRGRKQQRDQRNKRATKAKLASATAAKPAEAVEVISDILSTHRDRTNTVIHNTSWRACCFAEAPVSLLPCRARDERVCLMSTIDPPLTAYDSTGELEQRCRFVASFGAPTASLSHASPPSLATTAASSDADPNVLQDIIDARVLALEELELPKITACFRRKAIKILRDARVHVRGLLSDLAVHRAALPHQPRTMLALDVAPVERLLIRQMEVPEPISTRECAKLKYTIGSDKNASGETATPRLAVRISKFYMQSRSTAYIGIERSVRVEDDVILRYVPYFGDNESGKEIDVKWYDKIRHEEACDRSCLDDEVSEHFLRLVVTECGASPSVFRALQNVCGFNKAFSEYGEMKKDYESKQRTAQRMNDARALLHRKVEPTNGKLTYADAVAHTHLVTLFSAAPVLDETPIANKLLTERLAPPSTFFASNFARFDADPRVRRLGLRTASEYAPLAEHYRDLFCRMCYIYDCQKHGIEPPQQRARADPINPTLRYSPTALASTSNDTSAAQVVVVVDTPSLSPSQDAMDAQNEVADSSPSSSVELVDADNDSNSTGDTESTNAAQSLEKKRRSARPQTRVNTLATALMDDMPVVERGHRHKPTRTFVIPKVADESEFLDDSHVAMVSAKVRAFADTNTHNACSDACWKRCSALSGTLSGEADRKLEHVAAAALDSSATSNEDDEASATFKCTLSPTELVLLQKARDTVGDSACTLAALLPTMDCSALHAFFASERKRAPLAVEPSGVADTVTVDSRTFKKGRRSSSHKTDASKRHRTNRQHEQGSKHDFEPCNHDGACGPATDCSCTTRQHTCEKTCSCSRDCPNRFEGCRCSMGNCRTNACPCYVALRECNPDVCFTCGASEAPVLVYNNELQRQSALDLGICCNVNLQRGQHKQLGVSYSTTHGWGAFAREHIKRNEFIYEYKGAIISQEEAERRGNIYDKNAISFLFDANEDAVVDAIRKGNKSKFANHSAVNPKCMPKVIRVGGEHRIAFWAQQDIKRGEEIFFDYGYSGATAPDWSQLRLANSKRR